MVAIPLLSLVALGATLIPSTQAHQLSTRQTSQVVYLGCFNNAGSLKSQGLYTYQSSGYCTQMCWRQSMTVAATGQGSECLCGNDPPPSADLVADSNCNTPCSGFPAQWCGGRYTYTVWQLQQVAAGNGTTRAVPVASPTPSATTLQGGIIVDGDATASSYPTPIAASSSPAAGIATSRAVANASSSAAVGAFASSTSPTIPTNAAASRGELGTGSVLAAGLVAFVLNL